MKIVKSVLNLLVFSNVYISLIATAMYWDMSVQLYLPFDKNIAYSIFHGTLLVYSIHWFFNWNASGKTERLKWNTKYKWIVGIMAIMGVAGTVRYLYADPSLLPWMFIPAALVFVYELRMLNKNEIRFKLYGKTWILTFTWMYVTALMPVFFLHSNINLHTLASIGMQTCIIYLAALVFDKRDAATEKQFHLFYNNIQYFNLSVMIVDVFALLFILLAIITKQVNAFMWGKLGVLLLMNLMIKHSSRAKSDHWYYLLMDGLMGLPIGLIFKLI